jgi:hypothetical protein
MGVLTVRFDVTIRHEATGRVVHRGLLSLPHTFG